MLGSCRHDAELSAEAAARKLEALRVYGASQESAELLRVRAAVCSFQRSSYTRLRGLHIYMP